MEIDVLDGKKLVMPLRLTSPQAEQFTTLMPSAVIGMSGIRDMLGCSLPMAAYLIVFPHQRVVYGFN